MSNYNYVSNFGPRDSLPVSDPNKTIAGTEFDTEFGALETAVNSKADKTTVASENPKVHAQARIFIDDTYTPTFEWSRGFSGTISQEDDTDANLPVKPFIRAELSTTAPTRTQVMFQAFNTGVGFGVTSGFSRAFIVDYTLVGTTLDFKVLKDGSAFNQVMETTDISSNETLVVDVIIYDVPTS